jgi:hypothetical protein
LLLLLLLLLLLWLLLFVFHKMVLQQYLWDPSAAVLIAAILNRHLQHLLCCDVGAQGAVLQMSRTTGSAQHTF